MGTTDPDCILAAYRLIADDLLPSGAITDKQARVLTRAFLALMHERHELRGSILRTEAALVRAQDRLDLDLDRQPGPDTRLT